MPDDNDDQNDGNDLVSRSHIRGLEEKAARADALAAEVETLKKESVFNTALAGIDHPGLPYFKDGYKGDLTPEAIRQAAIEAGFGREATDPVPATQQQAPAQAGDLAAHQRMAAAQTGAAPPPPFDFAEALANAKSPAELDALIIQHGEKHGIVHSSVVQ